ncbi:MAG: hypothetical protein ACM32G_04825 [Betaproteobacteria bacterium]|jgi:hypothetical protein
MTDKKTTAPKKPAPAVAPAKASTTAAATTPRKPRPATRTSVREETKARNKKALVEALALARAVKIEPPAVAPVAAGKAADAKPAKAKKVKVVRDSFTMPEAEYAQIAALKKRIARYGGNAKKSELLRAGLTLLAGLNDVELTAAMSEVEPIKTGRPRK